MKRFLWITAGIILLMITLAADTQSPTSSNPTVNNTNPRLNETVLFNVTWDDNISTSSFIFSYNISGIWENLSSVRAYTYFLDNNSAESYSRQLLPLVAREFWNYSLPHNDLQIIAQSNHTTLENNTLPDACIISPIQIRSSLTGLGSGTLECFDGLVYRGLDEGPEPGGIIFMGLHFKYKYSDILALKNAEDENGSTGTLSPSASNAFDEDFSTRAKAAITGFVYENFSLNGIPNIDSARWFFSFSGDSSALAPTDMFQISFWNNSLDDWSIVYTNDSSIGVIFNVSIPISSVFFSQSIFRTRTLVSAWQDGQFVLGAAYYEGMLNYTNKLISSQNLTLINVSNIDRFSWKFYVNDTSGNWNVSTEEIIIIEKLKPNATVSILNKPLLDTEDLNGSITFSDDESDSWLENETRWYNNSIEITAFRNLTKIGAGNTSTNDTWVFSARVMDTFNWSDWRNDSVVIGDTIAPIINSFSSSSIAVITAQSIDFSINVTDADSPIQSDSCIIGLYQSNLVTTDFNLTTNSISDSVVSRTLSQLTIGTLQWRNLWCYDISSNRAENLSIGINISITAPVVGGGGGGGGVSASPCILELVAPRAGGTIQILSLLSGGISSSSPFSIVNSGSGQGEVTFSVTGNEYLKSNCEFSEDKLTLEPNINQDNFLLCEVPTGKEEGEIQISGCQGEANYKLVVGDEINFFGIETKLYFLIFGLFVFFLLFIFVLFGFGYLIRKVRN